MKLTYQDAGVNIQTGNELVNRIKPLAASTRRKGVMSGIGGFGALFELPWKDYKSPILVSSTDGVGTKVKLAIEMNQHETLGIDLVAMCVNDILAQGAEPLFFLDYYATGKLDLTKSESIISGIAKGCQEANMALIGGETAEMPGVYHEQDYDLAGFAVGIVEKDKLITGQSCQAGDILIALSSSGLHANGFSLVRKIIALGQYSLAEMIDSVPLGNTLITPTRIYVKSILHLLKAVPIKAIAHITGGGITENVPRVLPHYVSAIIDKSSWQLPAIFHWLQDKGQITEQEMFRTFNCGVGLIICVAPENAALTLAHLEQLGEQAWEIGKIIANEEEEPVVRFVS